MLNCIADNWNKISWQETTHSYLTQAHKDSIDMFDRKRWIDGDTRHWITYSPVTYVSYTKCNELIAVIARALFVFSIEFSGHMTFYLPIVQSRRHTDLKKIKSLVNFAFCICWLSVCFASILFLRYEKFKGKMTDFLFNIDGGYLEGLCRGFKCGILKQSDYLNLVQCETLEGSYDSFMFFSHSFCIVLIRERKW